MPIVQLEKWINVKNLDRTYGRINRADCISVSGFENDHRALAYLHRTPNFRWYREYRYPIAKSYNCNECTLEAAMSWIDYYHDGLMPLALGTDEKLNDSAKTPPPNTGGGIILRCFSCRTKEQEARKHIKKLQASLTDRERAILKCLESQEFPISARVIAEKSGLKYDSSLRRTLSQLQALELVVTPGHKGGYEVLRRKEL